MSNGFDDFVERSNKLRRENELLRQMVINLTHALSGIMECMPDHIAELPQVQLSKKICLETVRLLESRNESHSD